MNAKFSNLSQKLEIMRSILTLCEKNSETINLHIKTFDDMITLISSHIQLYVEEYFPIYKTFSKDYEAEKETCLKELKYFDNFSISKILSEESVLEDKADLYIKVAFLKIKDYEERESKIYNGLVDSFCKIYNIISVNEQITTKVLLEKCGTLSDKKMKPSLKIFKKSSFDLFPHVKFDKDHSIVKAKEKYLPQMCSSYSPFKMKNKTKFRLNELPSLNSTQINLKNTYIKAMSKSSSTVTFNKTGTNTQNSIYSLPNITNNIIIKDVEDIKRSVSVNTNEGYEKKLRHKINKVISMHVHSRKIYNLSEHYYNDDCSRFVKLILSLDKPQNFLIEDKIFPFFNKYMCLFIRNKVTDDEYSLVIGGDIKINTYEFIYEMEKLLCSSKLDCFVKFELTLYSFFSECIVDFHHKGHFEMKTNIKEQELMIYFKEIEKIENERDKLFKSI
jgi:hypothetical protein